jgi:hypothetical protein
MARNSPVMICIARQIPSSDPKFHHPLSVDGAFLAILSSGCLFRMGLFISLSVVVVLWIH